jgi:hypothetical protein
VEDLDHKDLVEDLVEDHDHKDLVEDLDHKLRGAGEEDLGNVGVPGQAVHRGRKKHSIKINYYYYLSLHKQNVLCYIYFYFLH